MESSSSSPTLRFVRGGYDWQVKAGSCAREQRAGATVDCSLTHRATAPFVSPVRTVVGGTTELPFDKIHTDSAIGVMPKWKQRDTEVKEAKDPNGAQFDAEDYEKVVEEEDENACRINAFHRLCNTEDWANISNPTEVKRDDAEHGGEPASESATEKPSRRYYTSPSKTPTITIARAPSQLTTTPPTTSGACNGGYPLSVATPILQTAVTTPTCSFTSTTLGGNTTPRNTRIGSQFCPPQFDHDDNGKRAMRPTTSAAALIEQLNSSLSSSRGGVGGIRARSRRSSLASVGSSESNGGFANNAKNNTYTTPANVARAPNTAPNTPRSSSTMGSQPQLHVVEEEEVSAAKRNRTSGKESLHCFPSASLSHSYTCKDKVKKVSRANSSLGNNSNSVTLSSVVGTLSPRPVRLFGAIGLTAPSTGTRSSTAADPPLAKGGAIRSRRSCSVSLLTDSDSQRNVNHHHHHATEITTSAVKATTAADTNKASQVDTTTSNTNGQTASAIDGRALLSTCCPAASVITNACTPPATTPNTSISCKSGEAVEGVRRRAASYCGVGVGGGGGGRARNLTKVPVAATAVHHQHYQNDNNNNNKNGQNPSAVRYHRVVPGSLLALTESENDNSNYRYYTHDDNTRVEGTTINTGRATYAVNDFWSHGKGVVSPPREELFEKQPEKSKMQFEEKGNNDENNNKKSTIALVIPHRSPARQQLRELSAVTDCEMDTEMIFSAAATSPQSDQLLCPAIVIINAEDNQKATPRDEDQKITTTCSTASAAQQTKVIGKEGEERVHNNGLFGIPFERSPFPQMGSPLVDEKISEEAPQSQPLVVSEVNKTMMPLGVQAGGPLALASIPISVSQQIKHNNDTTKAALIAAAAASAKTAVCGDHHHHVDAATAKVEGKVNLPRGVSNAALPLPLTSTPTPTELQKERLTREGTAIAKNRTVSSPTARSSPAPAQSRCAVVVRSGSSTRKQRSSSASSSCSSWTTIRRDLHRTAPTDTPASKKGGRQSKGFTSSSSATSSSCPTQRSSSAPAATAPLSDLVKSLSPLPMPSSSSRGVEEYSCGVYTRCLTCLGERLFVPRQSAVPQPPPHLTISNPNRENKGVGERGGERRGSPSRSKEGTAAVVSSSSGGKCTCSTTTTTNKKTAVEAIPTLTNKTNSISKRPVVNAPAPFLASLSPQVSPPQTPNAAASASAAAARTRLAQTDGNSCRGREHVHQRSLRELEERQKHENALFLGHRVPTDDETSAKTSVCRKSSLSEFISPPLSNASTPQQRNAPPCPSALTSSIIAEFISGGDGDRAKATGWRYSPNMSPNVGHTPSPSPPEADEDRDTRRRPSRDGATDAEGHRFEQHDNLCRGRRTTTNTTARQEGFDRRSPQDSLRSHLKKAVRAAEELKRIASASAAANSEQDQKGGSDKNTTCTKEGKEEKSLPATASSSNSLLTKEIPRPLLHNSAERDQGVNIDVGEIDEDAFVELTKENEILLARLVRLLS